MIVFKIAAIQSPAKEIYEDVLDMYRKDDFDILSNYYGHFSQELVNAFSENTEELLFSLGVKKSIVKKVFSILIEGLQNIRFHGEEDSESKHFGVFVLAIKNGNVRILFGSLISENKVELLTNRLSKLNSLNEDQVKEHYMEVLNNGIISEEGNAGLGFITMRLKSGSPLKINFFPLNNNLHLFTVEVNFISES